MNDAHAITTNAALTPGQAADAGAQTGALAGRIALVTAAGQGIGRAAALALAQEGATVIATDINSRSLADLEGNRGVFPRLLNVRDGAAVRTLVESLSHVDILFNCAGVAQSGSLLEISDEDWAFTLDVNVTAMMRLCRAVLPGMIARQSGVILNMGALVGGVISGPRQFLQSASKAAVVGLTRSIAADYAHEGIRANAICPGPVDSPSLSENLGLPRRASAEARAQALADLLARQPMGRIISPEEVAGLVVYLACDAARAISGTVQVIDGGLSNV